MSKVLPALFVLGALVTVACTADVRDRGYDDDNSDRVDAGKKKDGGSGDAGSVTCDPACGEDEQCVDGECLTASCTGMSEKTCDGQCVNTSTSRAHCGDCNNPCTASNGAVGECVDGECRERCENDPEGAYCDGIGTCSSGHCCQTGKSWCEEAATCADFTSDRANCGWCGHVCEDVINGHGTCSDSECHDECNQGFTLCNGVCVDYANDANNCGWCGHSCEGNPCVGHQCAETVSCTIEADVTWADCAGATIGAGQKVTMTASGSWSMVDFSSHKTCGPEGYSSNPSIWGDYRYDTRFGHGALIYGVGTPGAANNASGGFTSGAATWQATQTGTLIFQINDTDLSNNTGSMNVQLTITNP